MRVRTTLDEAKDDLIDKVAALAASRKGTGSPPGEAAAGSAPDPGIEAIDPEKLHPVLRWLDRALSR